MRNIKNIKLKEVFLSFMLTFAFVNSSAQTNLQKLDAYYGYGTYNELLVLSDSGNPITDTGCRKLCSELTLGKKGLWSRYYFENAPKTGQWYKNFVFFKVTKPSSFFEKYPECLALFDVVNRQYITYTNTVDSKQYLFLRNTNEILDDKNHYFYLCNYGLISTELINYTVDKNKVETAYVKTYDDGRNYLQFEIEGSTDKEPLNIYRFTDTDFISEDTPDAYVNKEAKYLLLQRDYKLGQKYNTVIFPVDVPLYEYHHLYNKGANRMIVYKLDGVDDNSLNFIRDNSEILKANTPYIIKSQLNDNTTSDEIISEYYLSETPVDHFDINQVQKVMSSGDVDIYAQYRRVVNQKNSTISPDEDIYVISGNKLVNCRNVQTTTVNRFRWYIKRPRSASATPMTLVFDGVTEIESVEAEKPHSDYVYDLNGVLQSKISKTTGLRKGYYIVDGKVRLIGE